MRSLVGFVLCTHLLFQTIHGIRYGNFLNEESIFEKDEENSVLPGLVDLKKGETATETNYNDSGFRLEASSGANLSSELQSDRNNSTPIVGSSFETTSYSPTASVPSSTNASTVGTLPETLGNESQSPSTFYRSSSESSAPEWTVANHSVTSSSIGDIINGSSTQTVDKGEEPEGVARGKPKIVENGNATTPKLESMYQKTLALINDTYTLSILAPVAAGVFLATSIILTVATCRCIRKRCRQRRQLRKKALPDSVKNLRHDSARLLAESSDEEF